MYLFTLEKVWKSLDGALTTRSDGREGIDMAAMIGGPMAFAMESEDLILTIIYDNNLYAEGLETRWGFSCKEL